jgi:hypothetical protein
MLDVHPPEHTPHTWRDFFIHIATIVIGLLIAIGLEQAVEAIHHHHQANHAREMLTQEAERNRKTLEQAIYVLGMHENYLFADLAVIDRLRTHTFKPTDIIVVWHPHPHFTDTAWRTVHESQAAGLLSYDELQNDSAMYTFQDGFNQEEAKASDALMQAATVVYRGSADRFDFKSANQASLPGSAVGAHGEAQARAAFENQAPHGEQLARLTSDEIDRLQQAIQEAIYADDSLLSRCAYLQASYYTHPQG